MAATAADFGRVYRKYSTIIRKGRPFEGTLYFSGGAVLKNVFLKEAIARVMEAPKVVSAQPDEVYGGMFRLAKRCLATEK